MEKRGTSLRSVFSHPVTYRFSSNKHDIYCTCTYSIVSSVDNFLTAPPSTTSAFLGPNCWFSFYCKNLF